MYQLYKLITFLRLIFLYTTGTFVLFIEYRRIERSSC